MTLFDKTTRGRAEIAIRGNNLSPRLRTLLLLVDGKTDSDKLLTKVAGLGLSASHLEILLEAGLIEAHVTVIAPLTVAPTTKPAINTDTFNESVASPPSAAPVFGIPQTQTILPIGKSQFECVYRFYNETIKNMIGLRGYSLQLRVERASSIDDFKEIRQLYLEAIFKSKGKEITRSLRDRLDQLLYLGEPGPNSINLE